MAWRRVVRSEQVPPGAIVAVDGMARPVGPSGVGVVVAELGERERVVWRTAGGTPCAMDARCPHQWSHLALDGVVDGEELVCCAHFWRFDTAGRGTKVNVKGRRDPKADVAVVGCREVDGWVEIDLADG